MRLLVSILVGLGVCVLVAAIALRFFYSRGKDRIDAAYQTAVVEASGGRFDVAQLDELPAPARRWLSTALDDGASIAGSVELKFGGQMRLSPETPWNTIHATQVIAADRYVWRARIDDDGVDLDANELYHSGTGEIRFWMHGFLPTGGAGQDLDRSLRGRLLVDRIFLPSSLLPSAGVRWEPIDERRAAAAVTVDGEILRLEVTVSEGGALEQVKVRRWSHRTSDGIHGEVPFGATILEHGTFDGRRIPVRLRYAWWHGTDREEAFLEPTVESASFH